MTAVNGAEALVSSLTQEGVEVVFGIPGVQVMGLVDAFYKQSKIRWITVRHEQTAAFMAFGYARTKGKEGIAIVVPGPGALNASAALGTAYAASTAVLLISGQIETHNLGQNHGVLHEVNDQLDAFRPITKWCQRVSQVDEIPTAVQEAIQQLRNGRPRPVELEIPWNLWQSSSEIKLPSTRKAVPDQPSHKQIREVAQSITAAERPVIWAGGGIITGNASKELTLLAEQLRAPVINTAEGKGAISAEHPFAMGNPNYGTNPVLPNADLVLIVGSRFSPYGRGQWTIKPSQKVIQIDIDPDEMGRNQTVNYGIITDIRLALKMLLEELPATTKSTWTADKLQKIRAQIIKKLKEIAPLQLDLIQTIRQELDDDDILIPGVTNVGYWSQLAYPVLKPRTYLTTSYFVTLGYAFPTALGAKIANPNKKVVAVCGDGGFLYALSELATAVQEGINVVSLVFVDNALGACLRIQQQRFGERILGTKLHNPDFARLAETFGARGIKLSHPQELKDGLKDALQENKPTVVEIPVDCMIPPWEVSLKP
jgi:acetolactate synthase-1/2/3 large subunit